SPPGVVSARDSRRRIGANRRVGLPRDRESGGRMTPVDIHLIAAARPNFMKIAPLYHALSRKSLCRAVIVHTGQLYDYNMSDSFFRDLKLPEPDFHLEV